MLLYEDFRARPSTVLRDIFNFVGVDPEQPIDNAAERNASVIPWTLHWAARLAPPGSYSLPSPGRTAPLHPPDLRGSSSVAVRVATASEVLAGRHPFLIKLNAEGAEFEVVPELFSKGIFPEWIVLLIHPLQGNVASLRRLVADHGYAIVEVAGATSLHCRRRVS